MVDEFECADLFLDLRVLDLARLDLEGGDNALQAQGGAASGGMDEQSRHHSAVNLLAMLCGSVVFVSKELSHRGLQDLQATVTAAATRLGLGANDTLSTLHYALNQSDLVCSLGGRQASGPRWQHEWFGGLRSLLTALEV